MHGRSFTSDRAAMARIDQEIGMMTWTFSHDLNRVKKKRMGAAHVFAVALALTTLVLTGRH
jgi:hypothetical protein